MTWNELNVKLAKLLLSFVLLTALLVGIGFVGAVGYCCLSEIFPRAGPIKQKIDFEKYGISTTPPLKGLKAYFEDSAPGQKAIAGQQDSVKQQ